MIRNLEWKISLVMTLMVIFVAVESWNGDISIFICSFMAFGYLAMRTINLFRDRSYAPKKCNPDSNYIGLEAPPPIQCPCGCESGCLYNDGRNTQGTLTFLLCPVCKCTYRVDDRREDIAC